MTTADLADRLAARKLGVRWLARCPAHDDRRASLSIAEGREGRVLLYCFAGCTTEDICRALGLHMRDLFPTPRKNGVQLSRADWERSRRERARIESAAERLRNEERALRLTFAEECRSLAGLARRTALRLRPDADGDEAAQCERLLAWLPAAQRRAMAAYQVCAFAPARSRARFALQPGERRAMVRATLLDGIRARDGSLLEVTG